MLWDEHLFCEAQRSAPRFCMAGFRSMLIAVVCQAKSPVSFRRYQILFLEWAVSAGSYDSSVREASVWRHHRRAASFEARHRDPVVWALVLVDAGTWDAV